MIDFAKTATCFRQPVLAYDPIKRLRDEVERGASTKAEKANHTLYLNEARYKRFRKYCESKDLRPSDIVDRLIALYLGEAED